MTKTLTEKRFFEWHEDDKAVTLRGCSGSYGGGSEVLVICDIERRSNVLHIVFEYNDAFTHGKWNRQECVMESIEECIRMYGLGKDCEYRIVSVESVGDERVNF